MNFQMFKLILEKAEEPKIKHPLDHGKSKRVPESEELLIQQNSYTHTHTHTQHTHTHTHTHRGIEGIMSQENRSQLKEFPRAQTGTF